jgi:hypothetical protein
MENTHDFKERAAKPGELRDDEDIVLMHPLNKVA